VVRFLLLYSFALCFCVQVSAENVGLSLIGRATQRVQGLLEVAERAVGQQKKRMEELTRFK
jgi:hypothetical protein